MFSDVDFTASNYVISPAAPHAPPAVGYSHEFRIGVYRPGSQTLTLIKDEKKTKADTLFKAQTWKTRLNLKKKKLKI